MPVTGGQQTAFYNDGGVGHGGFVANFQTAGAVIINPFNPKYPSKTIEQTNQIGAPLKQASVVGFDTATGTCQIPVDNTGNNPTFIQRGDYFIAPANYGGEWWYADDIGNTFQDGQFWKAEVNFRKIINH
jgi:hypothetical protein